MNLNDVLDEFKADAIAQAVVQSKGAAIIDPAGNLVLPPTTSNLYELLLAVIGQTILPPASGWRMANNALSKRLDAVQLVLDTIPQQLLAANDRVLAVVGELIGHVTDQYTAALTAQAQGFARDLAQARLDLHAEILGNAGPLLDLIHQLQAVDLADDTADSAIHNQLLNSLGAQATQLQQLLATTVTLSTNQASTTEGLNQVKTSVLGNSTDIASLRGTTTALRADLTSTQQQLATATTTANSAQALAAVHTGQISALQTDVAARLLATSFKGLRVATPAMAASATATINVSWPVPFADANYTISALPETSAVLGSFTLISHTKEGCVVSVKNLGLVTLLAGAATLHLLAKKD